MLLLDGTGSKNRVNRSSCGTSMMLRPALLLEPALAWRIVRRTGRWRYAIGGDLGRGLGRGFRVHGGPELDQLPLHVSRPLSRFHELIRDGDVVLLERADAFLVPLLTFPGYLE